MTQTALVDMVRYALDTLIATSIYELFRRDKFVSALPSINVDTLIMNLLVPLLITNLLERILVNSVIILRESRKRIRLSSEALSTVSSCLTV